MVIINFLLFSVVEYKEKKISYLEIVVRNRHVIIIKLLLLPL